MFKIKVISFILIFSILLIATSIIKNQTREIEKKIYELNKKISFQEKDIYETQLDFSYLTSPSVVEEKVNSLGNIQYLPMEHSKIFLSLSSFLELKNKFVVKRNNEKKTKIKILISIKKAFFLKII